jgi:phosphate transport system protein
MFKELIQAFRRKDVIKELSSEVGNMLDAGAWMFEQAGIALAHEVDWDAICDPLYERDRQINGIEQGIREQIVTHLSVGNQGDMGPCLVLMNVVKDAERIGDYCKNIFEVAKFFRGNYDHRAFSEPLEQIRLEISAQFEPTKQAFVEDNDDLANGILAKGGPISKQCDLLIQQLLSLDDDFSPAEAVAYVLLARHYKRVASHLANIATSVLSPIPFMDYKG